MINKEAKEKYDTDCWETPKYLFDYFDEMYHFTLDAAANEKNHKCEKYYTKEQNSLEQDWSNEIVWCNPPYSHPKLWIEKVISSNTLVALLVKDDCSVKWYNNAIEHAAFVYRINHRIKFVGPLYESNMTAIFPNCVFIFDPNYTGEFKHLYIDCRNKEKRNDS